MLAALAEVRKQEIERGVTLVGPHRDELLLKLGDLPAKGYASHGESWSYALALRLASYDLLRAEGNEPVLVLDDVFAELDARRRERLAELVAHGEQVLVTAAVDDDVPGVLAGRGTRWPAERRNAYDRGARMSEENLPRLWTVPRPPGPRCPNPPASTSPGSRCAPPRSRRRRGRGRAAEEAGPARRRAAVRCARRRTRPDGARRRDQPADHRAGWETPAAVGGVMGRWPQIVGEDLAKHCVPVRFDDEPDARVLTVQCDSTAWATQLRLLAPRLVARLNEDLGHGTVRIIKVLGPGRRGGGTGAAGAGVGGARRHVRLGRRAAGVVVARGPSGLRSRGAGTRRGRRARGRRARPFRPGGTHAHNVVERAPTTWWNVRPRRGGACPRGRGGRAPSGAAGPPLTTFATRCPRRATVRSAGWPSGALEPLSGYGESSRSRSGRHMRIQVPANPHECQWYR